MPSAHDKLPVTLYRMTLGGKVRIRKQVPGASSYDVVAEGPNEIVKPKHLDLKNYRAPNGASMRPMNDMQKQLIETFSGSNVELASIPQGTPLPKELIIIHEWTKGNDQHYSLQPRQEMKLAALTTPTNFQTKVQDFLKTYSTKTPQIKWLQQYRTPSKSKGPNGEPLKWDTKGRKWYYNDAKTKKDVTVPFKNP